MSMCLTVCTVIALNIARCKYQTLANDNEKHNSTSLQQCSNAVRSGRLWPFCNCFCDCTFERFTSWAYYFDQSLMRSHLLNCFERGEIQLLKRGGSRRRLKEYCSCRRPLIRGAQFIQCGACREWYISHQFLCKG